jgi:catechol 2,3-dioxygenase-like lactoylglutathione lyase family enzyme
MIKRVHHIGIAVNNLQESVALFEKLLGVKPHIEEVASQKEPKLSLKSATMWK